MHSQLRILLFTTPKIVTKRPLGGHLVLRDVLLMIISLKKEEKYEREKLILFQGEINISSLELYTLKFSLLEYISNVPPDTPGSFKMPEIEVRSWISHVRTLYM